MMEQKSNIQYRAEKEYKNSREKFFLLLREVISNSLHAVIIREKKDSNLIPKIDLDITLRDNECKITLRDNGEGFNQLNRECFVSLNSASAPQYQLSPVEIHFLEAFEAERKKLL